MAEDDDKHRPADVAAPESPSKSATMTQSPPTLQDDELHGLQSKKAAPTCSPKLLLLCCNLIIGLILSQVIPEWMDADTFTRFSHGMKVITMFHLSYIMINVGFEFEIDKTNLKKYGKDYLVACTAAGFPWIFCSLYFMFALGEEHNANWKYALVAGRFAAPTSAGILFTMLDAAGMKETWLYKKARILAIFDDLDTILLMVPLKGIIIGAKWELSIDLVLVFALCIILYVYLHRLHLPTTWYFIMLYAGIITCIAELTHYFTHSDEIDHGNVVETIHLEILLPAFTVGCVAVHHHTPKPAPGEKPKLPSRSKTMMQTMRDIKNTPQEKVKYCISAVFMVLVGLSMPSMFKDLEETSGHRRLLDRMLAAASGSSASAPKMGPGPLIGHVLACSFLMNLGKIFPAFCFRNEVGWKKRLALALGMMPRGEVCAGIIFNAIALGVTGAPINIAVLCLAVNMSSVSGIIYLVKKLNNADSSVAPTPPM